MDEIIVVVHDRPKLKAPILVEGLPGVGNVGKLAADHLVDEMPVKKMATLYSKHFPPQVLIEDNGVVRMVANHLHFFTSPSGQDVMVLSGDYQGMDSAGQYDLAHKVMEMAVKFGVSFVVTMGGYHVTRVLDKPQVLGAVTGEGEVGRMKEMGIVFTKGEPANGIIGASGLLLGMAQMRGIPGVCLMGETNGYFVGDPHGAKAVLEVLSKIIGAPIDCSKLDKKAEELEHFQKRLREIEEASETQSSEREHLQYIG